MTTAVDTRRRQKLLRGTSPLRSTAPRFLRGMARYADDIRLPRMLHAAVLRSPIAHAVLRSIDVAPARAMVGVHDALDPKTVNELLAPMAVPIRTQVQRQLECPVLTSDGRVRYVGEPVAIVAADSRAIAEDATEAIEADFEPLDVTVDVHAALEPSAALLYPDWETNVAFELAAHRGDPDAVFADAPIVLEHDFTVGRVAPSPLEGRGAVADYDAATGELTLWSSTQSPHYLRIVCSEVLGLPQSQIRVIATDIGGGFGQKDHPYPEEMLVSLLSMRTGRPVKWIEDRRENLLSGNHAREQRHHVRLAAGRDGTVLAVTNRVLVDVGANLHARGPGPAILSTVAMPGPYRMADYDAKTSGVVTNKVPFGAYRGYGHPEAVFAMERMMDLLAARLGMDPAELRLRNMVRPDELPFVSAAGREYDSGDYPESLRRVLRLVDYEGWREKQRRSRTDGRYVGIGVATNVESTGLGPAAIVERQGWRVGGYETASIRMAPDATVVLRMGTPSVGQGAEVALAQLCADELGVPLENVRVILNDTAQTPVSGLGTVASRTMAVGGSAVIRASRKLRDKLVRVAAHQLEVSPDAIEVGGAMLCVRGSDTGMPMTDAALRIQRGIGLPPEVTPGLEETAVFQPMAIPFAYISHCAVVEVDAATGFVRILAYGAVDDCGTIVNPAEVDGQLVGAIAQGIGEALLEEVVYDEQGQMLTGSFMDYLLPTATDVPDIALEHLDIPSPHTELGMKGVGEAGIVAPMAAIGNAISDALSPLGVQVMRMPATPLYLRTLIRRAQEAGAAKAAGAAASPRTS